MGRARWGTVEIYESRRSSVDLSRVKQHYMELNGNRVRAKSRLASCSEIGEARKS